MTEELSALLADRLSLLQEMCALGDFQPGSITSAVRRCGKAECHCARVGDAGHGPHFQLTQKIGGKTVTRSLPSAAFVRKAEREIAEFRRFQALSGALVELNRRICRLRSVEDAGRVGLKSSAG